MARILVLDDDRQTADLVVRQLTSAGHECKEAPSGEAAIEMARQGGYDLLILDVMLRAMSGFEVCRRLRRDPVLYTMPVLVVSAMNNEEEVLHGLAQGADDYVGKPFNPVNLLQRVEALIRARTDGGGIDPLTGLPGADSTKRELQRRISLNETFAVAYGELTQLREFAYKCGADARSRAIRHLARALQAVTQEMAGVPAFAGHMGGGHFVCILPPDKVQALCSRVRAAWQSHLGEFYTTIGRQKAYADAMEGKSGPEDPPILDVLFCVTLGDRAGMCTPQQLFETLSQLRTKALETSAGGIHLDRRMSR